MVSPKLGEKTENPQKYVLSHVEFFDRGLTQFDCGHCSAMKDFLFVASTNSCGTGGCEFFVFRKTGPTFEFLTSVFLNSSAFQILKSVHKGLPNIKTYFHQSAFDGKVVVFQYDGKNYQKIGKSKFIKSSELYNILRVESVKVVLMSKDLKIIEH